MQNDEVCKICKNYQKYQEWCDNCSISPSRPFFEGNNWWRYVDNPTHNAIMRVRAEIKERGVEITE